MRSVPQRIVIIGATSAIASAVAARYAVHGSSFLLVARDEQKLQHVVASLREQGAGSISVFVADLRARDQYPAIVQAAVTQLGQIDLVLVAHGTLPDQSVLDHDVDAAMESMLTNALSAMDLSHRFALTLADQGRGSLVVISSVAGDRGRRSNYVYGSAKAALTAYASGLRGTFREAGVHVLTVKPGPVTTPMTIGKKMPLMVSVDVVADAIVRAVVKRRQVVYTPTIWRFIMFVYRMLPERITMRLKF